MRAPLCVPPYPNGRHGDQTALCVVHVHLTRGSDMLRSALQSLVWLQS